MSESLSFEELHALIQRVFKPSEQDTRLALFVDLPDDTLGDHGAWRTRRAIARAWHEILAPKSRELGFETSLFVYRNVHANNNDLPESLWRWEEGEIPDHIDAMRDRPSVRLEDVLREHRLVIALTELSATAPLKIASPKYSCRAATMPGFGAAMIPALRLDYVEINRRCQLLKEILDRAEGASFSFVVDDKDEYSLKLDLRFRKAHASGGLIPSPGTAGNLPSGETYIVPYEGERDSDPSRSEGILPVQFDDEVVLYRIVENSAREVLSEGERSRREQEALRAEPAYGNMAELGLGVLGDFGIRPIGEILLDEKLGLHIAFGRSDHFGGQVGSAQFSSPSAVIHIDRVYIPETQPRVHVRSVILELENAETLNLIEDGKYAIDF